jgi:hypothetical protein
MSWGNFIKINNKVQEKLYLSINQDLNIISTFNLLRL